jgi:hypothetical protein
MQFCILCITDVAFNHQNEVYSGQFVLVQTEAISSAAFNPIALRGQFSTFFSDSKAKSRMIRRICFAKDGKQGRGNPNRVFKDIVEIAGS